MFGRPTHLKTKDQPRDWTSCGQQSPLLTWDYRRVTCLRCRKTRVWKLNNKINNKINNKRD